MKPQRLRQKHDRDCSVSVLAALAGVSEEEVLADLPDLENGRIGYGVVFRSLDQFFRASGTKSGLKSWTWAHLLQMATIQKK